MIALHRGIIALVRSALGGEKAQLPSDFDWVALKWIARQHQIVGLLYEGIRRSEVSVPDDILAFFKQGTMHGAVLDIRQLSEIEKITLAFETAGIDYMPLKGIRLKKLYPDSAMRTMSDADILIRMEQYGKIRPIMLELGYIEGKESDHELVWEKKDYLYLELHKRLIPSNNEDYFEYYGDGWQVAHRETDAGSAFAMSREDEFVFLFSHFAKHYRDGGIGIRHLTDLHLFLQAFSELDMSYILQELEMLRLKSFFENVRATIAAWFLNGEEDAKTEFISTHIINSGSYGAHDFQVLASVVREYEKNNSVSGARFIRFWKLTFPPYRTMAQKYGVLKKVPVLLPVFWVVRIIQVLFFTKGKLKQHTRDLRQTSAKNVESYRDALSYVGLDFNFEE